MNYKDRQNEIIRLQAEIISRKTKESIRNIYDDLWGKDVSNINDLDDNEVPEGLPPLPDLSELGIDTPKKTNKNLEKVKDQNIGKKKEEETPPEDIEDLKKELNEYIGLENIKEEVNDLINLVTIQKLREEHGLKTNDLSLHMVFTGNPGTGKTMIARMMSRIYKSLGILEKGHLVEVDRSGLVAGFVGQTALKTSEVIQKALGGVLFIDEAYALTNKTANDFGQEAVDTLLKAMEDNRDKLVVIVAGYTELMREFVKSNPGLESRFNRFLHFEDYTPDELLSIFKLNCKKNAYELAPDADDILKTILAFESFEVEGFGNARGVRNLFEKAIVEQANRLAKSDNITKETLMLLTNEDISKASGYKPPEIDLETDQKDE